MEGLNGRIVDLWRFDVAWQSNMNLVGDLRGQLVEVQRRNETDHRARHAQADLDQVGVPQRLGLRKSVNSLSLPDKFTRFHHFVQDMLWYTQFDCCGGTQDAVVIGKYFFIFDKNVISHKDIIQQKYHTFIKMWYLRCCLGYTAAAQPRSGMPR